MIRFLFCLCLAFWSSLHASSLKDFMTHLGETNHFNAAGSYQEQSAGHYSAGGLMIRQGNRSISPLNIQLPQMGMSCGNFDMRFGGLSFIKAQEFARMLKATAAGVPSYALQLALKTISPQIEGTMSSIRTLLQKINGSMLNECWARQSLLEGLAPTGSALHETVCQDMAQSSFKDDYTGARDRCTQKSAQVQALEKAKEKHKDLLVGEFNLVWHILNKMARYANDTERAELILSLVGTVISHKEGDQFRLSFFDPKVDEDSFLQAHLKGGTTKILKCKGSENPDEPTKCLEVTWVTKEISAESSLKKEVSKKVLELQRKYKAEEEFTSSEKAFLSDALNLPLYKYIQISAISPVDVGIDRASEYMALSMVMKNFEDVVVEVLEALSVLESVQWDTKVLQAFKKKVDLARSRLQLKIQSLDTNQMNLINRVVQAKEQELMASFEFERGF